MAGSRTQSAPRKGQQGVKRATNGAAGEVSAGAYAREAVTQWSNAARLAGAALRARRAARVEKPSLIERLNPATTPKGGRIGDAADWLLAKAGPPGRMASKLSLGSRMVERLRPGDSDEGGEPEAEREPEAPAEGEDADHTPPVPIQESIDVAVPIEVAWDLCKRFEDYPEFVERIDEVDFDRRGATFVGGARGRQQMTEVEIVDEYPAKRIDWEAVGGFEHSGTASFHSLAPGLTRIEVSIDLPAGGPLERVRRRLGLKERAIVAELRRFKAYAELWQDVEEPVANDEEPRGRAEPEVEDFDEAAGEGDVEPEDYEDAEGDYDEAEGEEDVEAEDYEDADFEDEDLDDEDFEDEEYEDEPDRAGSR